MLEASIVDTPIELRSLQCANLVVVLVSKVCMVSYIHMYVSITEHVRSNTIQEL